MSTPRLPFDVELSWGPQEMPAAPAAQRRPAGAVKLWLAFLADAGLVVVCCVSVSALVCWWYSPLRGASWWLVGVFALAVLASAVELACLWCLHGSVGMQLAGLRFSQPLTLAQALRVWLLVVASLPLAAVPALVGAPGARLVERIGGSAVTVGDARVAV